MKIAVLDIQGSVIEHVACLEALGIEVVRAKVSADLDDAAGLIIPGGESTTISKLLLRFGMFEKIRERVAAGMAVWGTCAGAILLAKKVESNTPVQSLELMDIEVTRNAYGRQIDSFETTLEVDLGSPTRVPAVFIRAPQIVSVKNDVKILARDSKKNIVAAQQGKLLATSFHPELTNDLKMHQYFVDLSSI